MLITFLQWLLGDGLPLFRLQHFDTHDIGLVDLSFGVDSFRALLY